MTPVAASPAQVAYRRRTVAREPPVRSPTTAAAVVAVGIRGQVAPVAPRVVRVRVGLPLAVVVKAEPWVPGQEEVEALEASPLRQRP